jgi:exo-1,4-beta-D-glucosaminidase
MHAVLKFGAALWIVAALAVVALAQELPTKKTAPFPSDAGKFWLHDNWQLQSSCKVNASGEQVSSASFHAAGWHRTTVPNTVVGALVQDKTLPNPDYGMNLKNYPGMDYSPKVFFANQDFPEDSPYKCSWWYRTEFNAPKLGKNTYLHFDGINYRANIWINGKKIADAQDVEGTFRIFEFDITKNLRPGKPNALAVEVFAPRKDDLAITWVDWNPTPPDKNMGLWKAVYLTGSGDVALRAPFISSELGDNYTTAALTASADLQNKTDHPIRGVLKVDIEKNHVRQVVELAPGETKTVILSPEQNPALKFDHPRIWWPYQMGAPNLYTAKFSFDITGANSSALKGETSDTAIVRFGIREIKSELTPQGYRLFTVNGKKILIRGGGWSSDILLRYLPQRLRNELRLTKDMGLNTIRLEGKLEVNEFFDMADEMGILIMPGWTCCDFWQFEDKWGPEQYKVSAASLHDQLQRLRNHASVLVFLYGSDEPPIAQVEENYLKVAKELRWPDPLLSSASQTPTTVTGKSGVKMTGPYEYVPPVYWLEDTQAGGAYGFNTETSPGPAIPPLESLKQFIPSDHLWPVDDVWNFHAGLERFTNINVFTHAMDERYGKAVDLDDFLRKSQAITYEGERAMFEAYARNKYESTGVIQWMLNNAWPSLIWHLYDYYLVPAGGYFGTKKACEMLHVQYSYDNNSVQVINQYEHPVNGLKVSAKILNLDATEKASRHATVDISPDSSTKAFELPAPEGLGTAYFLKLELHDATGKLLSDNFYWLSTKADVLNWAGRTDTDYTPQKEFEDVTSLQTLPTLKLVSHASSAPGKVQVTVENPTRSVAFMVHLRLTKGKSGEDVIPIFWDDNYFSLLPGESKTVGATYDIASLGGKPPSLEIDGWNIAPMPVALGAGSVTHSKGRRGKK